MKCRTRGNCCSIPNCFLGDFLTNLGNSSITLAPRELAISLFMRDQDSSIWLEGFCVVLEEIGHGEAEGETEGGGEEKWKR